MFVKVLGCIFGIPRDVCTLAAALSVKSPFAALTSEIDSGYSRILPVPTTTIYHHLPPRCATPCHPCHCRCCLARMMSANLLAVITSHVRIYYRLQVCRLYGYNRLYNITYPLLTNLQTTYCIRAGCLPVAEYLHCYNPLCFCIL